MAVFRAVKLPWIFLGAPLIFNGAPGNIQGNLDRYVCCMSFAVFLLFMYLVSPTFILKEHWHNDNNEAEWKNYTD